MSNIKTLLVNVLILKWDLWPNMLLPRSTSNQWDLYNKFSVGVHELADFITSEEIEYDIFFVFRKCRLCDRGQTIRNSCYPCKSFYRKLMIYNHFPSKLCCNIMYMGLISQPSKGCFIYSLFSLKVSLLLVTGKKLIRDYWCQQTQSFYVASFFMFPKKHLHVMMSRQH